MRQTLTSESRTATATSPKVLTNKKTMGPTKPKMALSWSAVSTFWRRRKRSAAMISNNPESNRKMAIPERIFCSISSTSLFHQLKQSEKDCG